MEMTMLLAALLNMPAVPSVTVHAIPHSEQRYETVGDWVWKDGGLVVTVSDLGDSRFNLLIAAHEITEALLCQRDGVTVAQVDAFDIAYEGDEPGDDPAAPYHHQHTEASRIERLLAEIMGVDWQEYEAAFEQLEETHD
jgi:hypothetical protein